MRLLLDTHALIWLLEDDERISQRVREAIIAPENEVFVSIVSFWEMAVKARIGKIRLPEMEQLMETITGNGFELLPLTPRHIAELTRLPVYVEHRDPFDHQLIAQAIAEGMTFVSQDKNASRYPVQLLRCSE